MQAVEKVDRTEVAGRKEKWPRLKLSKEHEQLWSETRAAVLWAQPAFADIWFAMMVDREGRQAWFTDRIPTCATDDKYMYINPSFYFGLTLEERVFVACHEIAHAMFNHCGLFYRMRKMGSIKYGDGVTLPYYDELMQVAADFAINAMLDEAKVGKCPKDGCLNRAVVPSGTSALDAYRILFKKGGGGKKGKGGGKPGKPGNQPGGSGTPESDINMQEASKNPDGKQGKGFDQHLEPGQGRGKTPSEAEAERNPQQWENAISAAMTSAKLRGTLPGNLERMFMATMESKADWSQLYLEKVSRAVGNDAYSWENLDQEMVIRGIGAPGRVRFGCELAIIARDSSGSINDPTLAVFNAETRGVLEMIKPRRIIVIDCDDKVHRWLEISGVDEIPDNCLGGGGTSFQPVFDKVEEMGEEPDVLIYLTDLYGDNPREPNYPVVWACINEQKGPWGQTIPVPEQANEGAI